MCGPYGCTMATAAAVEGCRADRLGHIQRCSSSSSLVGETAGSSEAAVAVRTAAISRVIAAVRRAGAAARRGAAAPAAEASAVVPIAETAAPVPGTTEAAAAILGRTAAAAAFGDSARRDAEYSDVEKDAGIPWTASKQPLSEECLFRHNSRYQNIRCSDLCSFTGSRSSLSSTTTDAQKSAATGFPAAHDDISSLFSIGTAASDAASLSSGYALDSAVRPSYPAPHLSLASSLVDARLHPSATAHGLPCTLATAVPAVAAAAAFSSSASSFSLLPQHTPFSAAALLRLAARLSSRLPGSLRILNEALQRNGGPDGVSMRTAKRTVTAASAAAAAAPYAFLSSIAAAECEKGCAAAAASAASGTSPAVVSGLTGCLTASRASLSEDGKNTAAREYGPARDSSHTRRKISSNAERENSCNMTAEDRVNRRRSSADEWKMNSAGSTTCCTSSGALMGTSRINSNYLQRRSRSSRRTWRRSSSSKAHNGTTSWRERNTNVSRSIGKQRYGNSSSWSQSRDSSHSSNRSQSNSRTQSNSKSRNSNKTWINIRWSKKRLERNHSSKRTVEEPGSQCASALVLGVSTTCDRYKSSSSRISTGVSADGQTQRCASCSAIMDCRRINREQLLRPLAAPATGEASPLQATLSTATSSRLLVSSPLPRAAGRRKVSSRHACSGSHSLLQHVLLLLLLLWKCDAERIWETSPHSGHTSLYSTSNSSSMYPKSPLLISYSYSFDSGRQTLEQPGSWLRRRHVDPPRQRSCPSLLLQSCKRQQSSLPLLPSFSRLAHANPTAPSTSAASLPAAIVPIHTFVVPAAPAPAPLRAADADADAAAAVNSRLLCSQVSQGPKTGEAAAAGGCWTVAIPPATAAWRAAAPEGAAGAAVAEKAAASSDKGKASRRSRDSFSSNSSSSFLKAFGCPRYNSKWWMNAHVDSWCIFGFTARGGNSLSVADAAAAAARASPRNLPAAVSAAGRGRTSSPAQQQRRFATPSNAWLLLLPSSDASAGLRPHTSLHSNVAVEKNGINRTRSSRSSSSVSSTGLRSSSVFLSCGCHSSGNSSNDRNSSTSKFSRSSNARWSSSSSKTGSSSGMRRTPSLISRRIGNCRSRRPRDTGKSSSRTQSTQHCNASEEKRESVDEEAQISSPVDLFEMLGVARDASAAEIEKGYQLAGRQVAAAGDGGCPALAEMIEAAYAILRDETLKKKYAATGCIPKRLHSSFRALEAMGPIAGSVSTSPSEEEAAAAGVTGRCFGEGKFQRREAAYPQAAESDEEAAEGDEAAEEAADDNSEEAPNLSKPLGLGGILSSLFTRGLGSGSSSKRQRPGEDVWADVQLLLSEIACRSVEKDVKVSVMRRCNRCRGTGAAGAAKPIPCDSCNGHGAITQVKRMPMGVLQSSHTCGSCGGSGIQPREVCLHCGGEGRRRVEGTLQVSIPAGVADGTTLTLRGRGDVGVAGGPAGDLLLNVEVTNDTPFRREGNNLLSIAKISYPDAVLGLPQKEVQVIDGTTTISIQPGTHSGDKIVIKGRGTVDATAVAEQEEVERKKPERMTGISPLKRGDHIVVVEIEVPDAVSADERRLLERLRELQPAKRSPH